MKNPSGYCQCGCGEQSPLARYSRRGYKRGEPLLFIKGHSSRKAGPEYKACDCGYDSPCWVWTKSLTSHGYGRVWTGERVDGAHRVYYERHKGPIPEGLQIDHLCRNRACVNPDHLEVVTHAENGRRGIHARLTEDQARAIRVSTEDATALAARLGICRSHVYAIRNNKRWKEEEWIRTT